MSESTLALAIFVVAFPLFWLLVFWLVAQVGGWNSLAQVYATDQSPSGETYSWSSGKLGFFSNYNNCLTVSVSDAGVRVQPMLLFRFAHKPLLFPWDSILALGIRREVFRYGTVLEVKRGEGVHPVTLYRQTLADSIGRYAPDRLTKPPGEH